ncbi:hypothetical protein [Flavobacterium davisii]|uniref:hypothetical protein n=1 Tax=Flavobacterium davisii TaxID=2906077 RepID=UPI0035D0A4AB
MNTINNFRNIIIFVAFFFFSFLFFFLVLEYYDNYMIISNKDEFIKYKVKVDSVNHEYIRTAKSSVNNVFLRYYYDNGKNFDVQNQKGILLKEDNINGIILNYMNKHNDSIILWVRNGKAQKIGNEKEKKIDTSTEIENNNRIRIYFIVYLCFLIFIKFRFITK